MASKSDQTTNAKRAVQDQQDRAAREAVGLGGQLADAPYYSADDIKVLLDPNVGATDILGISRYVTYAPGHEPVTKTMMDALTAKYGQPVRSHNNVPYDLNYTWMQPGVWEHTKNQMPGCYRDGATEFLWEDVGDAAPFNVQSQQFNTPGEFVGNVNLIAKNITHLGHCGIVVQVHMRLIKNGDYVGSMAIKLMNLTAADQKLHAFATAFWKAADSARTQQLKNDAGNKPNL